MSIEGNQVSCKFGRGVMGPSPWGHGQLVDPQKGKESTQEKANNQRTGGKTSASLVRWGGHAPERQE